MDTTNDEKILRCRRLGHEVPFKYCRTEGSETKPCRLLRDCWWEHFDIHTYVRENFPEETAESLETPAPPPNKVASLFDMIQQAQDRIKKK